MKNNNQIVPSASAFAALATAEVMPIDLVAEYWQPLNQGEQKRVIYNGIQQEKALDTRSGEEVELAVAYFLEATPDGKGKVIRNASRRLVGAFEGKPWFVPGQSMFLITYKGKKKFNNGNTGDDWSIQEMRLKKQPNPNANTQDNVDF